MSIAKKFMYALGAILLLAMLFAVVFVYRYQSELAQDRALSESDTITREAIRLLTLTDSMMMERVKSSMRLLREYGAELGEPQLGERVVVNDRETNNLLMGETPIANQFDLVDRTTNIMGGTATIFARDGEEYVRVSTNVMTPTGRAIGTILAPQGAAIKKIQQGTAFYGVVDILGSPYLTGYEPMTNRRGETLGVWYVGYKADLSDLFAAIASSRVLEQGFVVIRDNAGAIRVHSDNVSIETADKILADPGSEWRLQRSRFDAWGYEVVTAYSTKEIQSRVRDISVLLTAFIIAIGVVFLFIVYLLIQKVVVTPLHQTTARLHDIVDGEGDLTLRFNVVREDEIGELAKGFDSLLDRLQHTIKSVASATQQLSQSARHLKQIAVQSTSAINAQARDIEGIAAAIHEMSTTAQEVARNAASVATATLATSKDAEQGYKVLANTISSTETLAGSIDSAAKVIAEVADTSNEIGSVLNVIRSIAEQTNLLALNAAIEAARAGEQGRGFAVVADEVRSLASRTQASTTEVDNMVKRFQSNSERAMEQMRMADEMMRTNVTGAQSSGESIKAVLRNVSELSGLNSEISQAVVQQSYVAEDINKNISNINTAGDQNQARAQETLRASEALSQLSEDIQQQLAAYKV